jgi:glyoxylase-like metal-dependent hydrolase (beta-lactamase superfamily II)
MADRPSVNPEGLTEIRPGIWVIADGGVPLVPNIGIILGEHSALVVDCGLGPGNGRAVLDVAKRLAGGRRLFLTLTHFHPEHGFGAQSFAAEATILYNAAQRDELAAKGPGYLAMFRGFGPDVAGALEGTVLAPPHIAYDGAGCAIDLGGRRVQLRTWGMAHTAGDQVVILPADDVVFVGDLAENGIFPIFPWFPPDDADIDAARWIAVLRACEALAPHIVVPGHGPVGGVAILTAVRSYLEALSVDVAAQRATGATIDETLAKLGPTVVAAHPGWQAQEWVEHAIRYFFQTGQSR